MKSKPRGHRAPAGPLAVPGPDMHQALMDPNATAQGLVQAGVPPPILQAIARQHQKLGTPPNQLPPWLRK